MAKPVIAVIGGTGAQGGGTVAALLAQGQFGVRVITRDPAGPRAQALVAKGIEVVAGDLLVPKSLQSALSGAHGAFLVTNFWDPTQQAREAEVGISAVQAAHAAGVQHLIWSTLPNVEALTHGELHVVHFTGKAQVDAAVKMAGFPRHTFVHAPFYFQNLLGVLAPQPLPGGGKGWAVPINPAARVIHAGDVAEVGLAAAGAFAAGDALPNGSHLAVCGGLYSWNDMAAAMNAVGHQISVQQVAAEVYDTFYPGARELREMFQYFERCTYMGPDHEARTALARSVVPGGFTPLEVWCRENLAV
ncbi:MAG: NmrA family NAD(P)-binding protein [Candidatus Eisenbacteria bacterium]|nr:NmrA family NAD(P)-binding protein [Candidatus Eisenbacteria bacterium]